MASGSTPVKGRPYPLESDVPDVASDMHALALSLDTVPNFYQGSLTGRASVTPTIGDRYVVEGDSTASNNGIEYYWTGSAWIVADQPVWVNLTRATGITVNGSNQLGAARLVGDTVTLRGSLLNNSGSTWPSVVPFATLPSAMIPSNGRAIFGWRSLSTTMTTGSINPGTGVIFLNGSMAVGEAVFLDGQTFTL